jgi:uncharacterized protein (DUF1697 family)
VRQATSVPKYAAFLRAVNLGPTRKISSADLRSLFKELGFEDVATFRTSGNVVFEAGRESPAKLTAHIEEALGARLGGDVPIFLRTEKEIRALAAQEPFPPKLVDASQGKLQVILLANKAPAKAQKDVLSFAPDEDRLAFGDHELYWLPSGGIRDSPLNFRSLEKLLGPTTIRTKGTIDQLAAKFFRPA